MLSYVIATNKEPDILKPTFESIQRLTPHDYEIVICAPYEKPEWVADPRIRYVLDTINDGSTYGMNLAAQHSKGDWLLVGTDEHLVEYDVNAFLATAHSQPMQELEYQIINMGSPWGDTLNKQIVSFPPIDCTNIPEEIRGHSYPVITFPAVSRKTIETKFDGHMFNPHLTHHFVDHWMGCYVSAKNPLNSITNAGWTWRSFRDTVPNPKWDNHDANVFCNIASRLIQGDVGVTYTSNI